MFGCSVMFGCLGCLVWLVIVCRMISLVGNWFWYRNGMETAEESAIFLKNNQENRPLGLIIDRLLPYYYLKTDHVQIKPTVQFI